MGQDKKTATDSQQVEPRGVSAGRNPARVQGKDRDMGSALRSVYQKTVEEEVPADLLDLLGKLG